MVLQSLCTAKLQWYNGRIERKTETEATGEAQCDRQSRALCRLGQQRAKSAYGSTILQRALVHISFPTPQTRLMWCCSVICLEEFDDASEIRGLECRHVFHQQCLDDWFGRWNEYCPLCHRRIIPGKLKSQKLERSVDLPPPVAFMV